MSKSIFFRTLEINQRLPKIWVASIQEKQLGLGKNDKHEDLLTGPISTPSPELCGGLRATVNVKANRVAATRGGRVDVELHQKPPPDNCQCFTCLADSQKGPTAFIWLRTPLVGRALSPGLFVENNQQELSNITVVWGSDTSQGKQEADQKTYKQYLGMR